MMVSVIIPVYNVEKYLLKNINTVTATLREDIEFIYINDGSTDGSMELLTSAAYKDNRIRIISIPNGGLSHARNLGIKNSSGKYILFVDGDDFVDMNYLDKMIYMAEKEDCDLLNFLNEYVDDEGHVIKRKKGNFVNGEMEIYRGKDWLCGRRISTSVWSYLYKRTFLINNRLEMVNGLIHEDLEFVPRAIYYAPIIGVTNIQFYKYVQRPGSLMGTRGITRSRNLFLVGHLLCNWYKINVNEEICQKFFVNYIELIFIQCLHTAIMNGCHIDDIFLDYKERKEMMQLMKSSSKLKIKLMWLILSVRADRIYEKMYLCYWEYRNI